MSVSLPVQPSVAAEIAAGDIVTMAALARRLHVHPSTAFRWVSKGLPSPLGGRTYLEAVRKGNVWWTSSAATQRFFEQLSAPKAADAAPIFRPPSETARAAAAATKQLQERFGF